MRRLRLVLSAVFAFCCGHGAVAELPPPVHGEVGSHRPLAAPHPKPPLPTTEEVKTVETSRVQGSSPIPIVNEEAERMVSALQELQQAASASSPQARADQ